MKPNHPEEKFSEDPRENLHIENQLLKLKMQAESGAYFGNEDGELPPEIENDFLKQVQAFEEAWQHVKQVKVHDLLGNPDLKREEEMTDAEVDMELKKILEILEQHNMHLETLAEYEPRLIYRFVTEELFQHQTDDLQLPGWTTNFIYEEFHPNHKMDIQNRAVEFLNGWMEMKFSEYSWELNESFVLPDGAILKKEDVLSKMNMVFASFDSFANSAYEIGEVSFQWNERESTGLGHAEGHVQYNAIMENGEIIKFEGPFKLYMTNEGGWWNIFYFVFPGFCW
jgi:hypothetical protein